MWHGGRGWVLRVAGVACAGAGLPAIDCCAQLLGVMVHKASAGPFRGEGHPGGVALMIACLWLPAAPNACVVHGALGKSRSCLQ